MEEEKNNENLAQEVVRSGWRTVPVVFALREDTQYSQTTGRLRELGCIDLATITKITKEEQEEGEY